MAELSPSTEIAMCDWIVQFINFAIAIRTSLMLTGAHVRGVGVDQMAIQLQIFLKCRTLTVVGQVAYTSTASSRDGTGHHANIPLVWRMPSDASYELWLSELERMA